MLSYINSTFILQVMQAMFDIACTWVVLYFVLKIVRNNTRTIQIFKGIIFIVLIQAVANILNLKTMQMLAGMFVSWGPLALIVLFAPEIRSILEKLGKTNIFSRIATMTLNEREALIDELVKASVEMSATNTGALISMEQSHSLSDYIKTGTKMNSIVTSELLCSIFVPGTPLHDGAVIIQGDKIACASAYFPPTTFDFPSSYGARHRAAIGISEITDSISIVVSEETGQISVAEGGKLHAVNEEGLREYLMRTILHVESVVESTHKQIETTNIDEIEFANGKENMTHKGPRITDRLMKKRAPKKFDKHKIEEEPVVEEPKVEIEEKKQVKDKKVELVVQETKEKPEKEVKKRTRKAPVKHKEVDESEHALEDKLDEMFTHLDKLDDVEVAQEIVYEADDMKGSE